eukprot:CAMPEP_0195515780 /NCGR_PEP_ID=MMETSP0794_2-20130614/6728_1 /TAXON_ID=515487 /ORGANISM="Stephanopyxis turris, Strain CCMP 815" /LENGTH=616 /DNA_ID=CAMNT_0040644257 /DNA_START=65 /DNA_END=1912 /DNA_ORIENTATION=+
MTTAGSMPPHPMGGSEPSPLNAILANAATVPERKSMIDMELQNLREQGIAKERHGQFNLITSASGSGAINTMDKESWYKLQKQREEELRKNREDATQALRSYRHTPSRTSIFETAISANGGETGAEAMESQQTSIEPQIALFETNMDGKDAILPGGNTVLSSEIAPGDEMGLSPEIVAGGEMGLSPKTKEETDSEMVKQVGQESSIMDENMTGGIGGLEIEHLHIPTDSVQMNNPFDNTNENDQSPTVASPPNPFDDIDKNIQSPAVASFPNPFDHTDNGVPASITSSQCISSLSEPEEVIAVGKSNNQTLAVAPVSEAPPQPQPQPQPSIAPTSIGDTFSQPSNEYNMDGPSVGIPISSVPTNAMNVASSNFANATAGEEKPSENILVINNSFNNVKEQVKHAPPAVTESLVMEKEQEELSLLPNGSIGEQMNSVVTAQPNMDSFSAPIQDAAELLVTTTSVGDTDASILQSQSNTNTTCDSKCAVKVSFGLILQKSDLMKRVDISKHFVVATTKVLTSVLGESITYNPDFPPLIDSVEEDVLYNSQNGIARCVVKETVTFFQPAAVRGDPITYTKQTKTNIVNALRQSVADGSFAAEAKSSFSNSGYDTNKLVW